jgi:hypothetical protein
VDGPAMSIIGSVSVSVSDMLDSSVLNSSSIISFSQEDVVLVFGRVSIRLFHRARLRS